MQSKRKITLFTPLIPVAVFLSALLICIFLLTACGKESKPYGVFLGINGDEISKLASYETVVIEPTEFTKEQIEQLHRQGKTVFAYLNIGSLE